MTVEPLTKRPRAPASSVVPLEVGGAKDKSKLKDAMVFEVENEVRTVDDGINNEDAARNENLVVVSVTPVMRQSDIGIGCRESNASYFYKEGVRQYCRLCWPAEQTQP